MTAAGAWASGASFGAPPRGSMNAPSASTVSTAAATNHALGFASGFR